MTQPRAEKFVSCSCVNMTKRPSAKGYALITPTGNESHILSFTAPDPDATMASTKAADVHVAMRFGNKMRISPSVYNNHTDLDRLIAALP